jgi:hypothetical protein
MRIATRARSKNGDILLSVHTDDKNANGAKEIFIKDGAEDISYRGGAPVPKDQRSDDR